MLAKGRRSHSLYNYAGYILPFINIVYKPRNMWKNFSLLYRPNTINPVCHDTAYDSCGSVLTNPHLDNPPIEPDFGYPVGKKKKKWFSCQLNLPFEEDVCYC
jgi:hypothetical protein